MLFIIEFCYCFFLLPPFFCFVGKDDRIYFIVEGAPIVFKIFLLQGCGSASFNADPDLNPAFHFNADPDLALYSNTDPDPDSASSV
jgi:hypothetical protein